jgi:hypothetical protein
MKITIQDKIVDDIFSYVEKRQFPYYNYTFKEKIKEFETLSKFDFKRTIKGNILSQTMHGLGLAWSYHPHAWEVQTREMITPMQVWQDKAVLRKALTKRLNRGGLEMLLPNNEMTDSQIRKALRSYSGVQAVSNFRPSTAAAIYQKYCKPRGVVWDMSCGFGGRLLGAYASGNVSKYIGTDPSQKTMQGLLQMIDDFRHLPMDAELNMVGSEMFVPAEPVDLCFTSPPYFDTEKYADELSQSFKAYDTVERWNEDFLRQTIKNCYQALKSDGYLILNVANVKSHPNLERDTLEIAGQEKFELQEILKMQLSHISKGGFKYEPVFVFKKVEKMPIQRWLNG